VGRENPTNDGGAPEQILGPTGMVAGACVRQICHEVKADAGQETPMVHAAPLRVLIVEQERLVRAGFRALLERHDDLRVVAEVASGAEAVAEAGRVHPDVVLLVGDIGAARQVVAGQTNVLLLMTDAGDDRVFAALRAGVRGLLLEDAEPEALVDAVRVVARGETVLAPAFASRLVADFLSRPERLGSTPRQLEELTAREREVVALVACGLSNEEIAERLVVTRATAKTHVSRALCKLHARDRAQLVVLAYECGLVRPEPRRVTPLPTLSRARRDLHSVAALAS
jgi:DNA-binding NarL/FixJ family response regulator